jgi:hypothetical protein
LIDGGVEARSGGTPYSKVVGYIYGTSRGTARDDDDSRDINKQRNVAQPPADTI